MRIIAILTIGSMISVSTMAAEADHYSQSTADMQDIAELVNNRANLYLQKGLENLNSQSKCDDSKKSEMGLYKELKKYFANHGSGQLIKDILHGDDFPAHNVSKSDSIYGGWKIRDGFLLGRPGSSKSQLGLMPLIRIGDEKIGVDKLEHMFGMGLIYHKRYNVEGRDLTYVLNNGIFREKTVLGGNIIATGVFSYGDLSANFNGMRFWNHMLQKRDDVLGKEHNIGPYVKCENGVWKSTDKAIDFKNYVDASMDESINCRKLASKSGLEKSKQAMVDRGFSADACPRDRSILALMLVKYNIPIQGNKDSKTISNLIINPVGLGTVNYFREIPK